MLILADPSDLFVAVGYNLVLTRENALSNYPPDEVALVERAAKSDPAAIASLYDFYAPKIYTYVYHRLNDPNAALGSHWSGLLARDRGVERWKGVALVLFGVVVSDCAQSGH